MGDPRFTRLGAVDWLDAGRALLRTPAVSEVVCKDAAGKVVQATLGGGKAGAATTAALQNLLNATVCPSGATPVVAPPPPLASPPWYTTSPWKFVLPAAGVVLVGGVILLATRGSK